MSFRKKSTITFPTTNTVPKRPPKSERNVRKSYTDLSNSTCSLDTLNWMYNISWVASPLILGENVVYLSEYCMKE